MHRVRVFFWIHPAFLRGDCRPIKSITNTPVSLTIALIASAIQRVATASLGDRELQATTEGHKATRITAMTIQVDPGSLGVVRVVGSKK